jgi:molybdenum cofactor biosynthesis enzyme
MSKRRANVKTSTARKGDPLQASRGAAVKRAKAALGDAIDLRLNLDVDRMELDLLAAVTGLPRGDVRERLAVATLEELEQWRAAIAAPAERKEVA